MRKISRLSWLALLSLWLVGCSSTITNLSPTKQVRNASGMYPIEVAWDTQQQTVRTDSLTPTVVIDFENYPMRPVLGMRNRWETVVPVPASKKVITYHIRFDYLNNAFGQPQKAKLESPGYQLGIIEK